MSFVSAPGAEIYYETWPKGPRWVTLLNGFTRSLDDLRGMARALNESGMSVAALDNRGAGRTETTAAFTFDDSIDDVVRVWDEIGIESSGLLGISYGGALSLGTTIRYPERVQSLIVVSSTFRFNKIAIDNNGGVPDIKRYFSPKFVETHAVLVASLEKEMLRAFLQPGRPQAVRAQREAMRGFDLEPGLKDIAVPTLVVHGTEDRIVDFTEAQTLVTSIRGARLAPFVGSGHLLLAEAPKRLYELAAEFFRG